MAAVDEQHADDALPHTLATLRAGVERGLHSSARVHVQHRGVAWATGVGTTAAGHACDERTRYAWTCATKPLLAVGLGILADAREVDLLRSVRTWLPEAPDDWTPITLAHLLTHSVPWDGEPGAVAAHLAWDDAIDAILRTATLEPGRPVGEVASYSVWTGWMLLGEVARRVTGEPAASWLHGAVLEPYGMTSSTITQTPADFDLNAPDLALLHHRDGTAYLLDQRPWCDRGWPGLGGRGPVADLVALFQSLMHEARGDGPGVLSAASARAIVTPWRTDLVDATTGVDHAWGLGVTVDRRAIHPRASEGAFCHAGIASSCFAFADPGRDLVAAFVTDGIPTGLGAMARRFGITQAVYRDLLPRLGQ